MENNSTRVTRFAQWVIKRRWFIVAASLIITMFAASGGKNLVFNNDYHIFFDEDNPQVNAFDALQEKYTKDDNVFILVTPKDGKVFTKKTLKAVEELEKMGWQTPYSTRVDALSNYQHTRSEGDDMYVENLASDIDEKSEADLEAIKEIALNEELLLHRLVNEDGSVTAVNITVNLPMNNQEAPMEVMAYARNMVKEWKENNPDYETYLSGIVMLNGAFAESSMRDMGTLVPIMFLVILIVVLITTRSISAMFVSFIVLLFSIMGAMGLAGWSGIELTGPSSAAPTMIMTLAIADSIHVLVTIIQLMRKGTPKREAIVESLRINFMPVFMTSFTTIIGFLTLNFAEGAPFHDLGNITAMGVAFAFFFSIFLLPALLSVLPLWAKARNGKNGKALFVDRLAEFVIAKRKPVLVASVIAVLGLGFYSSQNILNNEFVKFFDKSVKFRTDTDFISDTLTGIYNVEFSINSGEEDGISNPDYLTKLDEFDQWMIQQPEVMHVNSFSYVMKKVNKSMHGDSLEFFAIPGNKQEAAQYLLLYEMSLPYGLDLNNQINVDKSETRFTATLQNVSSNEIIALTERAENWLKENAPEHMFAHGISPAIMFSHITRTNMDSMLQSGIGALILISIILIFALRSVKYGIISLIPNMTPIAVAFGIWAVFNGQINMAVTVVLGMTLGIVVDDTIHLLAKYIRARREMNKSPEDAIRYAFSTVGRAVIVTTIVLVAGFSVLMTSSFGFNSDMGKLTAITIAVALILDLFMLPTILIAIDKKETSTDEIKEADAAFVKTQN
jgi:predicted RND superfamily exporter protein